MNSNFASPNSKIFHIFNKESPFHSFFLRTLRNIFPFSPGKIHFCRDSAFRLFLLTRLICRSKSPLLISSARTYCINVGTVQE